MKKIIPDDQLNNDIFEMERFGHYIILKNIMSPDDLIEFEKYLKSEYSMQILKINTEIKKIRKKVSECDPLELLSFSAHNTWLGFIKPYDDFEISNDFINRSTEYIQSIFVSSPQNTTSSTCTDLSKKFHQIVNDIDYLHSLIKEFYFSFGAHLKELHPNLSDSTVELIIEAQVMYLVRGNRYPIFELEYYNNLLTEHNNIFLELFNLTSEEIIMGIKNLQYSLTLAKFDSFESLINLFENNQINYASNDKLLNEEKKKIEEIIDKCVGTRLNNVAQITGWPELFLKELAWEINDKNINFFNDSEFSGWPVIDLPVFKRPFIKIDNQYYCFDYYVFIDNFYRVLQKTITRLKPQYNWKDKQQVASEKMVENIFKTLLPNCQTLTSNYYPINNSKRNFAENDLIIIYNEVLIIVEVKAGSFVYTSPMKDFESHIKSYKSLIEKADYQCSRTKHYLQQHEQADLFDQERHIKSTIDMTKISKIYTISVTIDNINAIAAKAEKINFLTLNDSTISIGVDDLMVYREYFDSPLTFLHFLNQRTLATQEPKLLLNDELDHLGMYIKHNYYTLELKNIKNCCKSYFYGYRDDLDNYFNKLYSPQIKAEKPTQVMPDLFQEMIHWLDHSNIPNRFSMANYLLNFSTEAKEQLYESILYVINGQNSTKKTMPIHVSGLGDDSLRYTCFINQRNLSNFTIKQKRDYTLANLLRDTDDDRYLLDIFFNEENKIEKINIEKFHKNDILSTELNNIKQLSDSIAKNRLLQYKKTHKKIGRNDLCPCGSGLKYKRCCLLKNNNHISAKI